MCATWLNQVLMLDEVDIKIISRLIKNGRLSLTELSSGTNLSRVAIANRIEKLSQLGVLRFSALLSPQKLNYQTFIVELQVENAKAIQFKKTVQQFSQVVNCFEVIGPYNFLLVCAAKNSSTFREFVDMTLKKFASDCKVHVGASADFLPMRNIEHAI